MPKAPRPPKGVTRFPIIPTDAIALKGNSSVMISPTRRQLFCTIGSCGGDDPQWCKHIEAVVKANGDPWGFIKAEPHEFFARVPVFPSRHLWANCTIGEPDENHSSSVLLTLKQDPHNPIHLGYIDTRYEKRLVVRQMILGWLDGSWFAVPDCKERIHTSRSWSSLHNRAEAPDPDSLTAAQKADMWSLLDIGACLACSEFVADPSQDVPDL